MSGVVAFQRPARTDGDVLLADREERERQPRS
jgi:hypothetical protein